ncbi:MAG: cobalamin biosynthesis protein, partial [Blastocatellia bacterium]
SNHPSPNAGRPEAAMAGALGVQLGGVNYYDGEPHFWGYLGMALNPLNLKALDRSLRLTALVSASGFAVAVSVLGLKYGRVF